MNAIMTVSSAEQVQGDRRPVHLLVFRSSGTALIRA